MNIISPTGFWLEEDEVHVFIPELSKEIINQVAKNNIKSVYDFGCGNGEYLRDIAQFDPSIVATGFEGHIIDVAFDNVIKKDLSQPFDMPPVDLVISIEVGEHIPKEFEKTFIDNITKSAKKYIIISWAVVGQGGNGHINCQNNDYIISEITKRGWIFENETTDKVRKKMPDIWIKNTIMFFNKL
jgi:cyclopropane fatty-acyl-phospholipid synthase-like methyltransferase